MKFSLDNVPTLFGLVLATHRAYVAPSNHTSDESSHLEPYFPFESMIAAIAIAFFRSTVRLQPSEPLVLRCFFCIVLGCLAYTKKSYELITAVEIFSYTVSWLSLRPIRSSNHAYPWDILVIRLLLIVLGAVVSMVFSHAVFTVVSSNPILERLHKYTPFLVIRTLSYIFPIHEMRAAYTMMEQLALEPEFFRQMIYHLFFVTFHIQVGMGYLGISFLRAEQSRRNQLIRLDVLEPTNLPEKNASSTNTNGVSSDDRHKKMLEKSRIFQTGAAPFILLSALPYMAQIIFYGNINHYAYVCVQDELHRTIRFRQVFENDNHLTAMANDSPTSPEAYASSMNTVISTAYEMFNRKLFSLPKVLLLPGVMSRQPLLIAQVFPFIILSDWLKATIVSYMTTKIEDLQKEIQEISAVRSKVESFDIKNAELLQRSGKHATEFTQRRWESLTIQVQGRQIVSDLLGRGKGFFAFMQRNFIFTVLIDCALANLIAIGKIVPSEIFVYSRAIEDAVDMLLMRSRGEAELARMMTEIEKLSKLSTLWDTSKKPNLLRCLIDDGRHSLVSGSKHSNRLILRNLHYSRGTAMARADHIELGSGVYALTGANGSGKSTLFRILMSCHTNEKSIELPSSINLLTPSEPLTEDDDLRRETACLASLDDDEEPESCESSTADERRDLHHIPRLSITMPSQFVVEISQNFYWPLYSKPIDWIFQDYASNGFNSVENQNKIRKVAQELHSLQFFQHVDGEDDDLINSTSLAITMDGTTESLGEPKGKSAESTMIERIISELREDKDDWFGDLSGGQKSKVELVRSVFLKERCPDVLLIDETMAPLDPASKEVVMSKLKNFCRDSIVIVIYHTDVGQGKEVEGKVVDCVPSNEFFTMNIHLEKGIVHLRDTC